MFLDSLRIPAGEAIDFARDGACWRNCRRFLIVKVWEDFMEWWKYYGHTIGKHLRYQAICTSKNPETFHRTHLILTTKLVLPLGSRSKNGGFLISSAPFFFFATAPCYSGQGRVGDKTIGIAVKRQLQGIGPGKAATGQGTVDRHGLNNSDTNGATVDGSEIRRSPIEVGSLSHLQGSLSHYLQGFIHMRWLAGFLPSTECHNFCGLRFVLYKMMAVGCSSKSTTIPNITVLIYLAAGLGDVTSLCWMHDHFRVFRSYNWWGLGSVGKIPYVIPELYFINGSFISLSVSTYRGVHHQSWASWHWSQGHARPLSSTVAVAIANCCFPRSRQ